MRSAHHWFVVFAALSLALAAGCKRNTGARVVKAPGGGTNEEGPDDEEQGVGGGGGTDPIVAFSVNDEARAPAMEDAFQSLIRGDLTGVPKTLELGADMKEVVTKAIESENVNAVIGALKVLQKVDEGDYTGLIVKALDYSATSVRMQALDTVATRGIQGAAPKVVALLTDDELEVRATACDALADLKGADEARLAALAERLSDDEDVVRASCSAAFAGAAQADKWKEKVAKLLLSQSVASREGALRVLSQWRDETSFDLIRGRLSDAEPRVVAAALAAVAPFADSATVKEVQRFVKDERMSVRLEAVAALEQLPKDEVRNLVYESLKDREPTVRVEAASQLSRYPEDPETIIRLHALLRDENVGVRDAAALALLELGNPRSFQPVLDRLEDEADAMVLADLIDVLAKAAPKKAVPHLIDRLDKARGKEKARIAINLGKLTGQELPLESAKWREWYDKSKGAPGTGAEAGTGDTGGTGTE